MKNVTLHQAISPMASPRSERAPQVKRRRTFFYLGLGIALILVVFWGFAPSYYLRTEFGRPPLHSPLVHIHGFLFTTWMILLLVQSTLVRVGQVRLHRRLGIAGALLAALMVPIGVATALGSTRRVDAKTAEFVRTHQDLPAGYYEKANLRRNVSTVQPILGIIFIFGGLVAAGVGLRKRPGAHKRLMLLATYNVSGAALNRIAARLSFSSAVFNLVADGAFIAALVIHDLRTERCIPRPQFVEASQFWSSVPRHLNR